MVLPLPVWAAGTASPRSHMETARLLIQSRSKNKRQGDIKTSSGDSSLPPPPIVSPKKNMRRRYTNSIQCCCMLPPAGWEQKLQLPCYDFCPRLCLSPSLFHFPLETLGSFVASEAQPVQVSGDSMSLGIFQSCSFEICEASSSGLCNVPTASLEDTGCQGRVCFSPFAQPMRAVATKGDW